MVKYHDAKITVIQTDIDENNEKYKFEVCSITKLQEDGLFHFDGTDLESFIGGEEPDLQTYEIELRNRTTQVRACKEENGVFCTGRKCNTRIQGKHIKFGFKISNLILAIFDEVKNPCFPNQTTCSRFEPVREEIPYKFEEIQKYKDNLHRNWQKCILLTSQRLTSKSDLVSSCHYEQGSHKPSDPPKEYWESFTIVPDIDWIENESSPKVCTIVNSFSYCETELIQGELLELK